MMTGEGYVMNFHPGEHSAAQRIELQHLGFFAQKKPIT